MAERVVIEGHGLAVRVEGADPKRLRPNPHPVTVAPPSSLTWDQAMVLCATNPYWSEEENRAAEAG